MIVASIGYLHIRAKLQDWTFLESSMSINLNASNCEYGWLYFNASNFRELAVYLVTSVRGTPISCLLIIEYRSIWPYMKQV